MILQVFAMYDVKAASFGAPFFQSTVGLAIRGVTDLVNDPKTTASRYPSDFQLFQLGEYNDHDGSFKLLDRPKLLNPVSDFVVKEGR